MIFEVALIDVRPGEEAAFEKAFAEAGPLFQRAKGCRSMEIQRSFEFPNRYRLIVGWDTIENHMVDFRESEDFQAWRALAGPYFAQPPQVEHTEVAAKNF